VLTRDPICFFVNLDANSYSNNFREYIREEMDQDLAAGIETFGESLKSISVTASLEEMKITLNMTEDGENSLYTMLKQFDR